MPIYYQHMTETLCLKIKWHFDTVNKKFDRSANCKIRRLFFDSHIYKSNKNCWKSENFWSVNIARLPNLLSRILKELKNKTDCLG